MNEYFRLLVVLPLSVAALAAYFVVLQALFPRVVGRARRVAEAAPGRSLITGLLNFAVSGGVALALLGIADRLPEGGLKAIVTLPALIILLALGAGLSLGLGGVVLALRARLGEPEAGAAANWRRTAGAAAALALACLTPVVGWFILLPYAALLGLGAFILGFFWREPPASG
jgi:hypothetical protein